MQRPAWKEDIKKYKKEDKDKKTKKYDVAAYPFGADELLLAQEFRDRGNKEGEER